MGLLSIYCENYCLANVIYCIEIYLKRKPKRIFATKILHYHNISAKKRTEVNVGKKNILFSQICLQIVVRHEIESNFKFIKKCSKACCRVLLSGIPDNETPNLAILFPDKIYPEIVGVVIQNFIPIPDKFRITRPHCLNKNCFYPVQIAFKFWRK